MVAVLDKASASLIDWAQNHVKHQDLYQHKVKSMENSAGRLSVAYEDKTQVFVPQPILDTGKLAWVGEQHITLVTFNTKTNFQSLLDSWSELIKYKNLKLFFINPESTQDHKWIICPYVHNRICDSQSLKTGLKAMFETVDPINESEIKRMA